MSDRDQRLTKGLVKSRIGRVGSCPRVLRVPFSCVRQEGRLGVFVRSLRTMRMVCLSEDNEDGVWVHVSESSDAGLPGLSRISGH